MAISMYQASVPQLKKMLANLSTILIKGEEYASVKNIEGAVLTNDRLFPDMLPLSVQVFIACNQLNTGLGRLASIEPPEFDDTKTTFADLQERIAKTIAFVDSIKPEQLDNTGANEIKFSIKDMNFEFVGEQYLLTWVIPNFYFHVTTTYNILRHNGVEIGKADYLK